MTSKVVEIVTALGSFLISSLQDFLLIIINRLTEVTVLNAKSSIQKGGAAYRIRIKTGCGMDSADANAAAPLPFSNCAILATIIPTKGTDDSPITKRFWPRSFRTN